VIPAEAIVMSTRAALAAILVIGSLSALEPEKPMKATLVRYSGNVQGVGFRATAVMIARDYAVVGYVKNLSDGRVELLAEGPPADVDQFLKAIRDHWKDDVSKEDAENREPTGKFKTFEIAR
jgi:acylphosphatase